MSENSWLDEVKRALSSHEYMSGVSRTKDRVSATAEFFTPSSHVLEIIEYLEPGDYGPGKTVLDPACGDGQFLLAIKTLKMVRFNMSEGDALAEIYGVDIMRDNVDLCKARLGGGNIFMGNTLDPHKKLPSQTEVEHNKMIEIFGNSVAVQMASDKKQSRSVILPPELF